MIIRNQELSPTRVKLSDKLIAAIVKECERTEAFAKQDLEWIESILTRPDGTDGFETLTGSFGNVNPNGHVDLIGMAQTFNEQKKKLSEIDIHRGRVRLRNLLWSKRVSMYVQKRVLVLAPQRKQHPKYPAPNLHNYPGAGQSAGCTIVTCYGLDYVEARNTLVRQALSDPNCSHVFFVDDDILLPHDALPRLLEYSLPIVAGIYPKKHAALETNATTSLPDPEIVYRQGPVPIEVGNYKPIPVSCCGAGMMLISADALRKMSEPWFALIMTGDKTNIGEDSFFVQRAAEFGIKTHVVPGIIGVHVDFKTGKAYAPEPIVDAATNRIRPEFERVYQSWPTDVDVKELFAPDVKDFFRKNAGNGGAQ